MEGVEIQGRAIRLDYSRAASSRSASSSKAAASELRTTREPSDTLWVGNVGYETTKETIEAFWRDHEGFQRATIPQTRDGASSGMAFVKFADVESAQRAKAAVGRVGEAVLDGRRLVVDFAAPQTRKSVPGRPRRRDSEEEDGECVPELGRVGFALEEWVRVLNRNARDSSV
uniref:Nucleolar protein gar2 n=1 Tax=Mycena chlorophos TaxID=658473 RepID=A0ABQ0MCK9_MYCCL|nr:nucleolar protein gar2 [Mycena chlorophos]